MALAAAAVVVVEAVVAAAVSVARCLSRETHPWNHLRILTKLPEWFVAIWDWRAWMRFAFLRRRRSCLRPPKIGHQSMTRRR